MEKAADTVGEFSVLDKKSSSSNGDFISSMKMHTTSNLDHPFVADDGGGGGDTSTGGGDVVPTDNRSGANEVLSNMYRDYVGGENFANSTHLHQPFQKISSSYSYKSPAEEMATTMAYPFTAAQWKELERQAMIYKCMISSVPVPTDLLFPISANLHDSSVSLYSGRHSKNGDPEPGRCKRTDGKKWRCSKEVAPHQKYCERHLHRGRPRSRKPVEVKNKGEIHKKTRLEQSKSLPTVQSKPNCVVSQQFVAANEPLLLFNAETDLSISTPYYKETNRDLGLMMETCEQPWENLMEPNIGLTNEGFSDYTSSGPIYDQESLNLFSSYTNFPASEVEVVPNGFIDAWSIDNLNSRNNGNVESTISLNEGDLSPSLNLSMAMAVGNVLDEEMSNIEMASGVKLCDEDHKTKKDLMWPSPVSWEPFARGWPLGEALQSGPFVVAGSTPASPYNSISTPATTVSSPSGVLHWTLFSNSDSSVCNSPTFVAPPSEVSNQWHN